MSLAGELLVSPVFRATPALAAVVSPTRAATMGGRLEVGDARAPGPVGSTTSATICGRIDHDVHLQDRADGSSTPVVTGPDAEVLVADDDDAVRTTAAEILRNAGYDVVEAPDGEIALQVIRDRTVRVMVLDLSMPRVGGVDVLDALERPPVTVIASAYRLEPDESERLGPKIFSFLKKPVLPSILLEVVGQAMAHADKSVTN